MVGTRRTLRSPAVRLLLVPLLALMACGGGSGSTSPLDAAATSSTVGPVVADRPSPEVEEPPSTDEPAPEQEADAGRDPERGAEHPLAVEADPAALYMLPPAVGAQVEMGNLTLTVEEVTSSAGAVTVEATEQWGSDERFVFERLYRTEADGSLVLRPQDVLGSPGTPSRPTAVGDDIVVPPIAELERGAAVEGSTFVEYEDQDRDDGTWDASLRYEIEGDGYETVDTDIGTFEAYVVTVFGFGERNGDAHPSLIRFRFVPGWGLVKFTADEGGPNSTVIVTATTAAIPD
jgi:hypothetical protein